MPEEMGETQDPQSADFVALNYLAPGVSSKIARKRAQEEERRARILNAKTRTIGINVDVLDAQLALKKEMDDAEKAYTKAEDDDMMQVANQLKLLEVERNQMHVAATKEVVDYNAKFLSKEQRREYALSDPDQLKKEKPLPEELIGVSSVCRFAGEDPGKAQRVKAQHAQQRNWLEQQVFEKKMFADMEKGSDAEFAASQKDLLALRTQIEKEEDQLRKDVTASALEYNANKRKEKEEEKEKNRFQRSIQEKIADFREATFIATDPFLNETSAQVNGNGRIRRDHYRGLPKEYHVHAAEVQKHQVEMNKEMKAAMKAEDQEIDLAMEQTRRALVGLEKERLKVYKETIHDELHKNVVDEDRKSKQKVAAADLELFLANFGSSSR
mmetsp:Transcript_13144/g.32100  ORF Transcript_13144/g.32100 Transcript_13144/m.32100 type:complete len:384 (-) Transcript_13144:954-2105(-)|eukprot:CAMPEP_0179005766 /NCGR_PEP_ID=MMETSP0795-20121207/14142_1 /TAXON_ID=88552 /ORGANISM="Amoebophrya sp., Strain Ameob2" /LENGTH=383 /DNA_ID=CAMNT_0020700375 /DNA_START=24 /DNA_END=1175 /DNA_ORIENTATION=+